MRITNGSSLETFKVKYSIILNRGSFRWSDSTVGTYGVFECVLQNDYLSLKYMLKVGRFLYKK